MTIGVYRWTDYQDIVVDAKKAGLARDEDLLNSAVYLSPGLPKSYLCELPDILHASQTVAVQFNKPGEACEL